MSTGTEFPDFTIHRDGIEYRFCGFNRPEREGVYHCVTDDGIERELELCHFAKDSDGWVYPNMWCWRLPGRSCDEPEVLLGEPYWQPSWLKSVGAFVGEKHPTRPWTIEDSDNWRSVPTGISRFLSVKGGK